jgi:hypothetical protein
MPTTGSIPQPEEYGEHIARLNADVKGLNDSQIETKTLVTGLVGRFGEFEGRIYGIFAQMTQDNAKLLQSMTRQSSQATQGWQTTVKDIVKLTVAALIGYMFTKGA